MADATDHRALHDVVEELPDTFLDCRLGDHRWIRQGAPSAEARGLWLIRWRCSGCKGRRFDRVTRSGTLYGRWYEMPDGYGIRGFGHATRRKAVYREVLIERFGDDGDDITFGGDQ